MFGRRKEQPKPVDFSQQVAMPPLTAEQIQQQAPMQQQPYSTMPKIEPPISATVSMDIESRQALVDVMDFVYGFMETYGVNTIKKVEIVK